MPARRPWSVVFADTRSASLASWSGCGNRSIVPKTVHRIVSLNAGETKRARWLARSHSVRSVGSVPSLHRNLSGIVQAGGPHAGDGRAIQMGNCNWHSVLSGFRWFCAGLSDVFDRLGRRAARHWRTTSRIALDPGSAPTRLGSVANRVAISFIMPMGVSLFSHPASCAASSACVSPTALVPAFRRPRSSR